MFKLLIQQPQQGLGAYPGLHRPTQLISDELIKHILLPVSAGTHLHSEIFKGNKNV